MITELCYSHIFNMKRDSLHTKSFRRIHLSVFRYWLIKNCFVGPKSFQGFRKTDPCWSLRGGSTEVGNTNMFPVWNKNIGSQPFLQLFSIFNYTVFNSEVYIAVRVTLSNSKSGLIDDLISNVVFPWTGNYTKSFSFMWHSAWRPFFITKKKILLFPLQ